ncbi:hypothetical protein KI387_013883, partial [Taxus chinensis]
GLITPFRMDLSNKNFIEPCEALEASLCSKSVGSVDTSVIPFLEAQNVVMAKQLEKLFANSAHE